jgi:phosphatidylinositol glycan class A protein
MVCDFFFPKLGGVENHIWSLSHHLLQQGHKVIVITHAYDNRKGVRYMPGPLKVYYCPILPMTDQDALPTFTATLPLVRWILLRERINIVHAHQATSTMANESIAYASALGIASVYTDHSLFGFDDLGSVVLNRVLQTTLSTVDAAICVSHTCRDNLILRAHSHPSRVRVIPNAVDPSKFTPEPSRQGTDRIKVVVVSRLVYRKGIDLLVGIIPIICQHCEQVDFIIGGDGAKLLALQEMVERERLQERVEFLGSVPHSQVRNVLVRGHVFLNCSLTESFCIAILEAASCGLLVVSTNVGGVPEVLPDDMILLAEPNVPAMVGSLKKAVKSQFNPNMSLDPFKTHERVKQMYSWGRVASETTSVYDIVLKQKRHSFVERLQCYRSIGFISGLVACLIAITVSLVLRAVEFWQPTSEIDIVPDLVRATLDDEPKPTVANE